MLHVLLALMLALTTYAAAWMPARESYTYDGDGVLVRRTLTTAPTTASYRRPLGSGNAGWTATTSVGWGVNAGGSHTTTLQLAGNGLDWNNQVYRSGAALSDGATARLAFKLSQTNSQAVLAVESGDWTNYVGVYEAGGTLYLRTRLGASFTSPVTLTTGLLANTWYGLEISLDDAAGTRVSVWKEGQSGTRYEARYEMPRSLTWRFHAWASKGTLYLDGPTADGAYKEERPGGATSTTHIVGKHYEDTPSAQVRIKRYYAGGTLLAARQTYYGYPSGTEVTYVQGDHLGSTSTLTNGGGNVVGRERYSAFGERRRTSDTLITDQLYTGQRLNALSNLYHYSDGTSAGRFYDPLLGRFVQADSVTPGNTSIAFNRYAYANNSPIVFSDPSGHAAWADNDGPAYETHEEAIDAVGAYDASSATRWTGIYSEAYPTYSPPETDMGRRSEYNQRVWLWRLHKQTEAAKAAGEGPSFDLRATVNNLVTGIAAAAAFAAANGGDSGAATGLGSEAPGGVAIQGRAFSRYMSQAEANAVEETGLLRGGRPGETFFTTSKYQKAASAHEKLALPQEPEVRMDFRVKNAPSVEGPTRVQPKYGQPGGSIEYVTVDPVHVDVIRVRPLR